MRASAALTLATLGLFVAVETKATASFGVDLHAQDQFGSGSPSFCSPTGIPLKTFDLSHAEAEGAAQPGLLSVWAFADADPGERFVSAMATAGFTLDDVTVSGPGPTVTTHQNLLINGQVLAQPDSIATVTVSTSSSLVALGTTCLLAGQSWRRRCVAPERSRI